MSDSKSIIDDAWSSAVGGLDWLKSVLLGEFADNRPLSAMVADMLVSFAPGVVIVTSARDAVAVIIRLAQHPEKRDDSMEWIVLSACMITLALPLVMAAGGAAAAGVGAVVGGIAGSALGAALRAVMLLLIKESAKLVDVIRFLQKFIRGDIIAFLRAIRFVKYQKALLMAFNKTINKLIEICRGMRAKLEYVKYFEEAKQAIATLVEWERKFYAVQQSAMKQLPIAVAELDARLNKLVAQLAPKEGHAVVAAVPAPKPAVPAIKPQHVNDTAGKPLQSSVLDKPKPSQAPAEPAVKSEKKAKGASGAGGPPGGSGASKPPRKDRPDKIKQADEGPNTKRQEVIDPDAGRIDERNAKLLTASHDEFASVYAKAPAAKAEIDELAEQIAARHGGRVAKAPIKSEKRALEKINKDYLGDANRIKDLARNTIIVPSGKIDEVARELEQLGANVKRIVPDLQGYGYSGVNSTLRTKSGLIGEIQVNSPEMIYAKEPEALARAILGDSAYDSIASKAQVPGGMGHAYYELGRSMDMGAEQMKIMEDSRAYYDLIRSAANGN